jgi:hypothetical protein
MRTAFVIIGSLAIAFALAWEFVPLQVTIWDDGYDLVVNVTSEAGPLRSVSCKACGQREVADWILENPLHAEAQASVIADPIDGRPLSLYLPLSGRTSPLGREIRQFQPCRCLVVIGRLQDGRQLAKIVGIPDSRNSREVSVSLP